MSLSTVFAWLKTVVAAVVLACTGHPGHGGNHGGGGSGGGTTQTHSVGGTATGLAGSGLVLRNNGGDSLAVTQSGVFTFATKLTSGGTYNVTVAAQPASPKQICSIARGNGTVASGDVKDVQVTCVTVPLMLASSTPATGATGVAQNSPLTLAFSAPLAASTVTSGSITLLGSSGPATISVAAAGNTLTVTPVSALAASAAYTLTVSTAVTGAAGEQLAAAIKVTFQTGGTPWTSLIGRTITFAAGNEGYECTSIDLTADVYIKGFRIVAGPTVLRALVSLRDDNIPLGNFDCTSGSSGSKLIYAAASGTTDFSFPAGIGMHLQAGQRVVLVMHLSSPATVTDEDERIFIQAGTANEVTTSAEMILQGSQGFVIPADAMAHSVPGYWIPTHSQLIVAFLPLMRTLATHQTVTRTRQDVLQNVLDVDFNPLAQIYHSVAGISLEPGDVVTTHCTFINSTSGLVYFGDGSYNESCYTAVYLTPSFDQNALVGIPGATSF